MCYDAQFKDMMRTFSGTPNTRVDIVNEDRLGNDDSQIENGLRNTIVDSTKMR